MTISIPPLRCGSQQLAVEEDTIASESASNYSPSKTGTQILTPGIGMETMRYRRSDLRASPLTFQRCLITLCPGEDYVLKFCLAGSHNPAY